MAGLLRVPVGGAFLRFVACGPGAVGSSLGAGLLCVPGAVGSSLGAGLLCAGRRRVQPWGRAAACRAAPSCVLLLVAQLWLSISNFARNSPVSSSILESASLELQRFRVVSKNDRGKLRAKFVWAGTWQC